MISLITGKIAKVGKTEKYTFLDIMTNAGVGYRIIVGNNESYILGKELLLYTSFQVREDSQTLYGFKSESERDFFELLITVSGVGPKIAVAILSTYSMGEVCAFIANKDHQSLSKVSGLGSKGAQKIVVELENRIDGYDISNETIMNRVVNSELEQALKALGFTGEALSLYLKKGEKFTNKVKSIDELLKKVLQEND
jgi:Holliday junction DNA helicase RuvA